MQQQAMKHMYIEYYVTNTFKKCIGALIRHYYDQYIGKSECNVSKVKKLSHNMRSSTIVY